MEITKDLLDILVCPRCRGELHPIRTVEGVEGLSCPACAVVYPVRNDIPVMLEEEAIPRASWDQGLRTVKN